VTIDTVVRFRTHAKVNLFLRVLGPRTDGYHEVETILHGVGIFDEIEIAPASDGIHVAMDFAAGVEGTLPSDEENLVRRAAELLRDGRDDRGARVTVTKGIPIAAGLGGGSGNAAGMLATLAELWDLGMDRASLLAAAESLGSDVPYCLDGGTALATARGEKVTPLPQMTSMWFVLGGTAAPLATRAVYDAWDRLPPLEESSVTPVVMALGAGETREVAALLVNELEPAAVALMPDLAAKKQALLDAGALGACMSGSGPTMYAIASDEHHARSLAAGVEDRFDWVRVVGSQQACIQRLD
jgi:4-diphosphocytidyl-2C-methyl-D-erythritol kinase